MQQQEEEGSASGPRPPQFMLPLAMPCGGVADLVQDIPVPVQAAPVSNALVTAKEASEAVKGHDGLLTAAVVEALVDGGKAMYAVFALYGALQCAARSVDDICVPFAACYKVTHVVWFRLRVAPFRFHSSRFAVKVWTNWTKNCLRTA